MQCVIVIGSYGGERQTEPFEAITRNFKELLKEYPNEGFSATRIKDLLRDVF
jgi:hypothetical protein